MKSFSERYGYIKEKDIQFEKIDHETRNRLSNVIIPLFKDYPTGKIIFEFLADNFFKIAHNVDEISSAMPEYTISDFLTKDVWHKVYSLIESISFYTSNLKNKTYNMREFNKNINNVLIEEKAGYRFLEGQIIPITNENELESIKNSISTKYKTVNIHMTKALNFYADRVNPDYANSIKESISSVESMCKIIIGSDGATLKPALDKLKKNGVRIHQAQIDAYSKLYGYTSDENGIRHAGITFESPSEEDAKYMLISCSAFVNYLIQKYETVKNNMD